MAGGFGVGEGGGQGSPDRVGEDPVGVVGEGHANVLFEAVSGCGSWCAAGQDGWGGLLVARLEVAEGFFGCCGLLFVAALCVPLGGGAGQVHGGEEQGDRTRGLHALHGRLLAARLRAGRHSEGHRTSRPPAPLRQPADQARRVREDGLRASRSYQRGHDAEIYTHLWPDSEERTRAAVDKAYADQSADARPQVDEAA
ncbi:hypothetical protein GCM10023323_28810 [Streptomyces thinghirensis]|uniref:Uncharacterized protein n=1 Tax=Streptomyces thinghirensis TaxID=551547 RepID=A0ABP9T1A3_9ACTN